MAFSIFHPGSAGVAGTVSAQHLAQAEVRRAFRTLRRWSLSYLVASALVFAASLVVLHDASFGSAIGAWIRCGVVVLIAAIIYALILRAQRGQRREYRIMRVFVWLESIGFIVVAVIVPGYPLWLRVTSLVVGLFAVATAVASGDRRIRAAFADNV